MQLVELTSGSASPKPDIFLSRCADLLQLTVWLTPVGTVDEGGVEQPAYLNFDAALLGRPSGNQMEVSLLCRSVPAHSCSTQPRMQPHLAQSWHSALGMLGSTALKGPCRSLLQAAWSLRVSTTALLARPQARRLWHTACVPQHLDRGHWMALTDSLYTVLRRASLARPTTACSWARAR